MNHELDLPRISIVMPSYNQAGFLENSIHSVLSQGYPNKELILIDGGSADGSLEIIQSYQDRLAYWVRKRPWAEPCDQQGFQTLHRRSDHLPQQ